MNSCYDVLANTIMVIAEPSTLQADDVAPNSQLDYLEVYNRNTIFFNGSMGRYYKQPYVTVYRSNYLLENVDLISEITMKIKIE